MVPTEVEPVNSPVVRRYLERVASNSLVVDRKHEAGAGGGLSVQARSALVFRSSLDNYLTLLWRQMLGVVNRHGNDALAHSPPRARSARMISSRSFLSTLINHHSCGPRAAICGGVRSVGMNAPACCSFSIRSANLDISQSSPRRGISDWVWLVRS